jgi:hypothetical protein
VAGPRAARSPENGREALDGGVLVSSAALVAGNHRGRAPAVRAPNSGICRQIGGVHWR